MDTCRLRVITGAPFLTAPTAFSSQPADLRLLVSPDAITLFLGKQLLLSFNPLSGHRSGLRFSFSGLLVLLHLICPLLTSQRYSVSVSRYPASFLRSTGEISRGKTRYHRCINAGFTKCIVLPQIEDFAVTCPLVPNASRLISDSCSSPRSFGFGFLQTLPRDNALAVLLAFGSACLAIGLSPTK